MAKKSTRMSSSRNAKSRSRKSTLKSKPRFSYFQVVILAAFVAVVGLIASVRMGDTTNAAGLINLGTTRPGLIGAVAATGYKANAVPTVGKITLVGQNFSGATGVAIGNTVVPITSMTSSGGTQTVTANIPAPATVSNSAGANVQCKLNKTEPSEPTSRGSFDCGQIQPGNCTAGTASCNTHIGSASGGCPLMTAGCNPNTSSVTTTAVNSSGQPVGTATDIKTNLGGPAIFTTSVSGNTTTITGTNLGTNPTVIVGHSRSIGTLMSTNNDGTETVSATVNTSSCFLNSVPLLNRLCTSAGTGKNAVKVSSGGQSSNSLSVNLGKSSSSPSIGAATSMSGSGGFSAGPTSGSAGNGSLVVKDPCGGYVAGIPGAAGGTNSAGALKVIKPTGSDVWNYGSPFTFSWINPGTPITPTANAVITHVGALAQVTLQANPNGGGAAGGCIHYNIENGGDMDEQGAAKAHAADTDHDLCPANVVRICDKNWNENENAAPGCGTDPGGSSNCDTDDNFAAFAAMTDTDDQDGATSGAEQQVGGGGMLCFGVLPSGGVYNDPHVGDAGATITVTVSSCRFGKPVSGSYRAFVQAFGLSGPSTCVPGHRCSGLPTRIQQAASGYSAYFQIN